MAVRVQIYYLWSGRTTLLHVYVCMRLPRDVSEVRQSLSIYLCHVRSLASLASLAVAWQSGESSRSTQSDVISIIYRCGKSLHASASASTLLQ